MSEDKSKLDRIEEMVREIKENESKREKKKEFKFPFRARVGAAKAKKNYITIMKVNENRNVQMSREPIVEQTVVIDGIPRLTTGEHVLTYKKNPLIILPSWNVIPFSPSRDYEESLKNGSNVAGFRLLMNRMQIEAIKLGKKIGGLGLTIGGVVIGVIIVYALWKG